MTERLWEELEGGACHLWWWRPGSTWDEPLVRRGTDFLTGDERERYGRYLVPDAARMFLAARVFLRSILSVYTGCAPGEWRFETNPWGRPHIANAGAANRLAFNLSHKSGCVTCLTGAGRDLGVDVENVLQDRPHLIELAERFFSPAESAGLCALPTGQHVSRFYELWTLKEAYIKARGMGLSLGLGKFSFSVTGDTAAVRFDSGFDDDAEQWDFRLFRSQLPFLISTAVRRDRRPLSIEMLAGEPVVARALSGSDRVI